MYPPMTFRLVSSMALVAAHAATGCGGDDTSNDAGTGGGVMGDGRGVRVSATFTTACARKSDGAVVCWGRNNGEQLGDSTTTDRGAPGAVPNVGPAVDVAVGGFHACAALQTGGVKCWGTNRNGQLGFGMEMTQPMGAVDVSSLTDAIAVTAGNAHSCALRRSGIAAPPHSGRATSFSPAPCSRHDHTHSPRRSPSRVGPLCAHFSLDPGVLCDGQLLCA